MVYYMLSPIDFFGEMDIKVEGKTQDVKRLYFTMYRCLVVFMYDFESKITGFLGCILFRIPFSKRLIYYWIIGCFCCVWWKE